MGTAFKGKKVAFQAPTISRIAMVRLGIISLEHSLCSRIQIAFGVAS